MSMKGNAKHFCYTKSANTFRYHKPWFTLYRLDCKALATLQIFTPWKLRGLGIAGSLQGKPALSMEKGCTNCQETHNNYWTYNYHLVSSQFLQLFSIDSAGFFCRDPAIPSSHSFHGVKTCSVLISLGEIDSFLAGIGRNWGFGAHCMFQSPFKLIQWSR
jgi:hypothetical protein